MDVERLIEEAMKAREMAYAPYSEFRVGAALLDGDGTIYSGCNIENASYGACNCAERTAIFKAVSEGAGDFRAIAIVGGKDKAVTEFCPPCGICRQVLQEFGTKELRVIVAKSTEDYKEYGFEELLPFGFGGESIR